VSSHIYFVLRITHEDGAVPNRRRGFYMLFKKKKKRFSFLLFRKNQFFREKRFVSSGWDREPYAQLDSGLGAERKIKIWDQKQKEEENLRSCKKGFCHTKRRRVKWPALILLFFPPPCPFLEKLKLSEF